MVRNRLSGLIVALSLFFTPASFAVGPKQSSLKPQVKAYRWTVGPSEIKPVFVMIPGGATPSAPQLMPPSLVPAKPAQAPVVQITPEPAAAAEGMPGQTAPARTLEVIQDAVSENPGQAPVSSQKLDKVFDGKRGPDSADLIADFTQNFQPGKPWTPKQAPETPEAKETVKLLKNKSRSLNVQFNRSANQSRLKSTLMDGLNHDIGNKLAIVMGVVPMLQKTEGPVSKQRALFYEMIHRNLKAANQIKDDYMDMAKLDSGKSHFTSEKIDMRAMMTEHAQLQEAQARQKNITIAFFLPEGPVWLKADRNAMNSAVNNLLGNAIKYTPKNGIVTLGVSVNQAKKTATVYVQDNGIGVSAKDQKKIFSGFYRTAESQKMAPGTGIGLPVVKKLVKASGSALKVQSEPGKGSRFYFDLPLAD